MADNYRQFDLPRGVSGSSGIFESSIGDILEEDFFPKQVQQETATLLNYWNGASWIKKPVKYWNGTAWVDAKLKIYKDSTWT